MGRKTKLNIGDKIWTFVIEHRKFKVVESFVKRKEVDITQNNDKWVVCTFEYNGELRCNFEKDCFATRAEAQKECDRRNKK